jgi:predicted dehydrogenase
LKLAMIGCGFIRPQHMSGIYDEAPEIEVAAACDVSRERLEAFCRRYGIARAYDSAAELFERGGVEAVSIAVKPEEAKVRLAREAMQHGLHVLTEKPMALTVAEAEAMAATARRTGRVLQIAFNRRFEPVYRRAAEILHDRERFGDVAGLDARFAAPGRHPYVMFMSQIPHTLDLIHLLFLG